MVDQVVMRRIALAVEILVGVGVDVVDKVAGVVLHQLASRSKAEDRAGVASGCGRSGRREGRGLRW